MKYVIKIRKGETTLQKNLFISNHFVAANARGVLSIAS